MKTKNIDQQIQDVKNELQKLETQKQNQEKKDELTLPQRIKDAEKNVEHLRLQLQKNCNHDWCETGSNIDIWWGIVYYKCSRCQITKTEPFWWVNTAPPW